MDSISNDDRSNGMVESGWNEMSGCIPIIKWNWQRMEMNLFFEMEHIGKWLGPGNNQTNEQTLGALDSFENVAVNFSKK